VNEQMISKEEDLSIAAMHRIIKKSGSDRVSMSACRELSKVLEEIGVSIGKEALDFMMHAGRKTVKGRDIKIVAKKFQSIIQK
jgi:histone H3/H4